MCSIDATNHDKTQIFNQIFPTAAVHLWAMGKPQFNRGNRQMNICICQGQEGWAFWQEHAAIDLCVCV